ncbi:putative QA-SNARE protein [Leptomonas pyrrhocoris]|uniref:Putative QA-SNARE protein n=1 Tax=Leptomonas pyrrhocoris TaxID=157538 RepID=A0A0M9G5D2_LEPPY|nr:putative QA-SNARE protein [Leptomonas pyrrhocoris]XP_015661056.1 putative QA-SNARE protein [Leptomonas pyrrhocoris]KPA82616.1 putative QA-SNARE protein [Leptomonas pyrrhocoris]KPA82617.1 putative QA-SNARE protein [Leptomonas pyrrhocoris]|eukprot:XP_015661055.1 putative QA-SNARE protein [Leptomonas pyrrhocoris]
MPLENGELLSRSIQQVNKACQDVQLAMRELGTGRDAIARDKLRRTRLLMQQCNDRVEIVTKGADSSLDALQQEYAQITTQFASLNAEATRRERQTFRQTDPGSLREAGLDALDSQVTFKQVQPVDLCEFHTEEAIQREKLQHAREIESDVMDLKTTYQEFHSLVHQQQDGLDKMTNNVTESKSLIEQGHNQIQGASRRQKSFRKIGCIGCAVLVVVVIIVIIIVVLVTR